MESDSKKKTPSSIALRDLTSILLDSKMAWMLDNRVQAVQTRTCSHRVRTVPSRAQSIAVATLCAAADDARLTVIALPPSPASLPGRQACRQAGLPPPR